MILSPRQWLINRAHERIKQRVRSRYQQVKAEPTQGMFNFRCHENAVQYVMTRPEQQLSIYEVMMIDPTPILHYLVRDEQGTFHEVTLGVFATPLEYYLIKQVNPDDFMNIGGEFNRSVKDWCEEFVGWFGRKMLRISRCC
jgi:hypothetical protein